MSKSNQWPPPSIRISKQCFLLVRAMNANQISSSIPLPTQWQEQEVRHIHTPEFTWTLPSNTIFYQTVLKTWTTRNKRWHISLIHKTPIPFQTPLLHTKDILFSEREVRKVGVWNGIPWIQSEKGFRLVLQNTQSVDTLISKKMLEDIDSKRD